MRGVFHPTGRWPSDAIDSGSATEREQDHNEPIAAG
jgi:hypothetical protein